MRINKPLSPKELKDGDLIPPGNYDFMVLDAIDTTSKSGNEMMKLKLRVWLSDGRERVIFDYLLEQIPYKVGHFAESTGLMEKYNNGEMNAMDCIGKSGQLKIYIQKDTTGQYGDKSAVADYLMPDENTKSKVSSKPIDSKFDDNLDELPF